MINLDITPNFKMVNINGKNVKVPKLGLRHRLLVKEELNHEEMTKVLMNSIAPNLSMAERDILTLHLLAYNDRMASTKVVNGFEYNIENVYICQKLKFVLNGFEFKFRSPSFELLKGPADILLKECCIYVKKDGKQVDVPDFMDMPPFVLNWVEQITNKIAIDGPTGQIRGLYEIVELFSG